MRMNWAIGEGDQGLGRIGRQEFADRGGGVAR